MKMKEHTMNAQDIANDIQETLYALEAMQVEHARMVASEKAEAEEKAKPTIKIQAQFAEFTRVFVTKTIVDPATEKVTRVSEMKTQPITLSITAIASVRPSNRLGFPNHRSTVLLFDGTEIDLMDVYSDVKRTLGVK
jgi:hypothetical protein